jgi:3-(3-hydroxy-phenyl)propionate hydroxylase
VIDGISPDDLLDSYHAERHAVGARVQRNAMAQTALRRPDDRSQALGEYVAEFLSADVPRKRMVGEISGLDIHYDFGEGHPLLGRRMPDLDIVTAAGPTRVFTLLHDARPVLLDVGGSENLATVPRSDRVRSVHATYGGAWELPVIGAVAPPSAVLIRPDGYVAWVGTGSAVGLRDAMAAWFGSPAR